MNRVKFPELTAVCRLANVEKQILRNMGICSFSLCNYSLTPCKLSCYKFEVLSGFFGSGCCDCCCRNGFREFFRDSRAYLRQIFLAVGAKCPRCTHLARPTGRSDSPSLPSISVITRLMLCSPSWNWQSFKLFFGSGRGASAHGRNSSSACKELHDACIMNRGIGMSSFQYDLFRISLPIPRLKSDHSS